MADAPFAGIANTCSFTPSSSPTGSAPSCAATSGPSIVSAGNRPHPLTTEGIHQRAVLEFADDLRAQLIGFEPLFQLARSALVRVGSIRVRRTGWPEIPLHTAAPAPATIESSPGIRRAGG